jgi:hypothetical protein
MVVRHSQSREIYYLVDVLKDRRQLFGAARPPFRVLEVEVFDHHNTAGYLQIVLPVPSNHTFKNFVFEDTLKLFPHSK